MQILVSLIVALAALATFAASVLLPGTGSTGVAQAAGSWRYVSPVPGSSLVSPGTAIVLRNGAAIAGNSVSEKLFRVTGGLSGVHAGEVHLADDGATIVFKPQLPFEPAETVTVSVAEGLTTSSGRVLDGIDFTFKTWPAEDEAEHTSAAPADPTPGSAPAGPNGAGLLTLPADFPGITITVPASNTAPGYLFLDNLSFGQTYLLMLDNSGEPVYYQRMTPTRSVLGFTKQPNGQLTYYDSLDGFFYGLDTTYSMVSTYPAGNGYRADHHDLKILPNGHYQVLIWDGHTVDMSQVVPGGQPKAWVIGLTVQELDTQHNVVFEWRSWDHIALTETLESLTAKTITLVHGNAIEPDSDGNILVSCRNLDAIIKIDRQTGDILWRLGGKRNQFTFAGDQGFHRQHDIRRLPNGDITLFDNRTDLLPLYSRAVEYRLDEVKKSATLVWHYHHAPEIYSPWLSNVQRLPNGNTLVSWGGSRPNVTEVTAAGTPVFELGYATDAQLSYRVFRFPWQGRPAWPPDLVLEEGAGKHILHFSWNGATEIASYRILAGNTRRPQLVIGQQDKRSFETTFDVASYAGDYCYFRVLPIDRNGHETTYSNVVFSSLASSHCYAGYLPVIR